MLNYEKELSGDLPVLKKCRLFAGIPEDQYAAALNCMDAMLMRARKGEIILSFGDPFRYSYFLLEGGLTVSFLTESADEVTMNHFSPGSLLGESFACIKGYKSPIELEAECDSRFLRLDLQPLLQPVHCTFAYQHILMTNLLMMLAGQNVFLNQKIRILSQKGVRDRIMVYLSSLHKLSDGSVVLPFSKTDLAAFLGLNRSAMSRELSRMEEDGVLKMKGRKITVLQNEPVI